MSGRKREKEDSGGFGRRAYEADMHVYMYILGGRVVIPLCGALKNV